MSYSQCEKPIEWHGCSASSVLSVLDSIPFSEMQVGTEGKELW